MPFLGENLKAKNFEEYKMYPKLTNQYSIERKSAEKRQSMAIIDDF